LGRGREAVCGKGEARGKGARAVGKRGEGWTGKETRGKKGRQDTGGLSTASSFYRSWSRP